MRGAIEYFAERRSEFLSAERLIGLRPQVHGKSLTCRPSYQSAMARG